MSSTKSPTPAAEDAESPLLTARMLEQFARGADIARPLRVSGPVGELIALCFGACVVIALVAACLGRVEVTSRARGVMRPMDGLSAIASRSEGLVSEVQVSAGAHVAAGDLLVRIDSTQILVELMAARSRLQIAEEQAEALATLREGLHKEAEQLLSRRARLARGRMRNQRSEAKRLDARRKSFDGLRQEGLVSDRDIVDAEGRANAALRGYLSIDQELASVRLEGNELERSLEREVRQWEVEKQRATADVEAAELRLSRSEVRAPFAGSVESLLVGVGQAVQHGSLLGNIVPDTLGDRAVVFVPERDRAFVKAGATVRLEVDQLPVVEFGARHGRVLRVSRAVASDPEIREVFGSDSPLRGPHFRVEVSLLTERARRLPALRTGAWVTGFVTLRRQRIITLVLEPLRGLFE